MAFDCVATNVSHFISTTSTPAFNQKEKEDNKAGREDIKERPGPSHRLIVKESEGGFAGMPFRGFGEHTTSDFHRIVATIVSEGLLNANKKIISGFTIRAIKTHFIAT